MRAILGKFYSYYLKVEIIPSLSFKRQGLDQVRKRWETDDATVSKIRLSEGYRVESYRKLVEEIANVTLWNKEYEMFYRGQTTDYKDKNGKSVIYPTICRPGKKEGGDYKASIRQEEVKQRYQVLNDLIDFYDRRRNKLDEYYYSLFQHYEVHTTPFIDITQSIRTAATFALRGCDIGYLYVFGLPYPNGSISHYIDSEIVLVKLQNVSPSDAFRPRYQEGYLVGKLPIKANKTGSDNLARRMIAKFLLDNTSGKFWDDNFPKLPEEVIFPTDDLYAKELSNVKTKFESK